MIRVTPLSRSGRIRTRRAAARPTRSPTSDITAVTTPKTAAETTGGNPLFLEQMLAMLQDAPGGDVAVPPTISALLAARLDRLGDAQRDVVGTASVVGQIFPQAAVVELVPDTIQTSVGLVPQMVR